jgi:hypothetical protein
MQTTTISGSLARNGKKLAQGCHKLCDIRYSVLSLPICAVPLKCEPFPTKSLPSFSTCSPPPFSAVLIQRFLYHHSRFEGFRFLAFYTASSITCFSDILGFLNKLLQPKQQRPQELNSRCVPPLSSSALPQPLLPCLVCPA